MAGVALPPPSAFGGSRVTPASGDPTVVSHSGTLRPRWVFVRLCPDFRDFLGFFCRVAMFGWWGGAGFWGLRGGAAGFWAWVRWGRFVRICPDFRIFGRRRADRGARHRRAPGFGGWIGLVAGVGWLAGLASFALRGASFSNSRKIQRSERRLSFRLCDPGEPPQPEVAGGSGRRVLWRGRAAQ